MVIYYRQKLASIDIIRYFSFLIRRDGTSLPLNGNSPKLQREALSFEEIRNVILILNDKKR